MPTSDVPPPSLPPLPTLPITSPATLDKCRSLPVGAKDIFIASFPKSGTTWMQNIVVQLLLAQRRFDHPNADELSLRHISDYSPFYDIDAHWEHDESSSSTPKLIPKIREAHESLGYRVFNTHLRWDMLPLSRDARYIYVVRDGRDVLTSFYHHLSNQHAQDGGFEGSFAEFFDLFLQGKIAYGKWSHHLVSWLPHAVAANKESPILVVYYQDLKQDLRNQILRIASFLQLSSLSANTSSSSILDRIQERVSFEYMRKHQSVFHPISVRWKIGYHFIRSGTVGDYKSLFEKEHQERFQESILSDFRELKLLPLPKTATATSTKDNTCTETQKQEAWLEKVLADFGDMVEPTDKTTSSS